MNGFVPAGRLHPPTAVDGFSMTGGVYLDNDEYGPFPVCSRNGVIAHNFASGHNDAAIYVGDDDNVEVRNNLTRAASAGCPAPSEAAHRSLGGEGPRSRAGWTRDSRGYGSHTGSPPESGWSSVR